MENEKKVRTYEEYVRSKKEEINSTLDKVVTSSRDIIRSRQDRLFIDFVDVLALHLSPNVNERPNQAIKLGFKPNMIPRIDLNGSQGSAALEIIESLVLDENDQGIHAFAENLRNSFGFQD